MRKIVISTFVSLDGVMQAPGGPEEDPSGGFEYGGWGVPRFDDTVGAAMDELFSRPYDLLLGRRTYDIFAAHWPHVSADSEHAAIAEQFNRVAKYVATHRPESLDWNNSHGLGEDIVASLRELKAQDGPYLLVQGSAELIQQLLAAGLADEIHVLVFPLLLGKGKRLFGGRAIPAGLKLTQSTASSSGVVISRYERAGEVETGSFALEQPSEAEIERRRQLQS